MDLHSKKKIVFVPSFRYLSDPLFFSIMTIIREEYSVVYLDPKDPFLYYKDYSLTNTKKIPQYISLEYYSYEFLHKYLKINFFKKILYFFEFLTKIRQYQSCLRVTIENLHPDAIVVTSDSTFASKILNKWAFDCKIPFIVIQPTFVDTIIPSVSKRIKNNFLYFLFNKMLTVTLINRQYVFGNEFDSNYIFIWGEYFSDIYEVLAIKKNVRVVGNPVYFELTNKIKNKKNRNLDFDVEKPIITICTEALKYTKGKLLNKKINSIYRNIVINNPDLNFIIKIHPRDDREEYDTYFRELNCTNYKIIDNISLYEIFDYTDVQISVNSYSSFEAVLFGIPIILFNRRLLGVKNYFSEEIELTAEDETELNKKIRIALTEDYKKSFIIKREKFLESRIGKLDSSFEERFLQNIECILTDNI